MLTNALQRAPTERSSQGNDYNTGKFRARIASTFTATPTEKSKDWFVAGVARKANSPDRYVAPQRPAMNDRLRRPSSADLA